MAFTQFTEDMDIISKLPDDPSADLGVTPDMLKAEFDKAGKSIKKFINDTLLQEALEQPTFVGLVKSDGNTVVQAEAGTDYQAPLKAGSVTMELLGEDVTPAALGAASLDENGRVEAEQTFAPVGYIGESMTLAPVHAGRFYRVGSATAVTITIGAEADGAWPADSEIELCQWGAGAVTISGASGVVVESMDGAKTIAGQFGCVCLKRITDNYWLLSGALA